MSTAFELDGFEPIKRLGGGGFGDVWLAKQTNVDREVAVKVGHAPIEDQTIKLRFERECKALGRLSGHPNIVDVFTAGSLTDGRPYLVLEYIDSGTLWQRLKSRALSEQELIAVGAQLSGALDKAHTSGILHRDLKPENILMRSSGEAVLGDFGIARLQDGANTTSAAITASVAYAAPEVLSGTKASVASDIYGVGICLLAAIIRSVPFVEKHDESIHPIIKRVLSDAPPQSRGHGISEELAETVDWTLAKQPSDRPESARELRERFLELQRRVGPATPSTGFVPAAPGNGERVGVPQPPRSAVTANSPAAVAVADKSAESSLMDGLPATTASSPTLGDRLATPHGSSVARQEILTGRQASATTGRPSVTMDDVRSFAVAYVGTVMVGGLLIWLISRVIG